MFSNKEKNSPPVGHRKSLALLSFARQRFSWLSSTCMRGAASLSLSHCRVVVLSGVGKMWEGDGQGCKHEAM